MVANIGYLSENPSVRNVAILGMATLAQLVRISCEEEVLGQDPVRRVPSVECAIDSSRTCTERPTMQNEPGTTENDEDSSFARWRSCS